MTKPGWQTSEFYVNVGSIIIALLTALGVKVTRQDDILSIVATLSTALISVVYTWQRTALKQANSTPQVMTAPAQATDNT